MVQKGSSGKFRFEDNMDSSITKKRGASTANLPNNDPNLAGDGDD